MKLRLPGRRRGSTPEGHPPTSAGSEASRLLEESRDTFRAPDPTSATSASEYADLNITWVRDKGGMRTFSYSGVTYRVFGERAGDYFLGIETTGKKMGGTLDHGPFQTLEDCKQKIRLRLSQDIKRYGQAS